MIPISSFNRPKADYDTVQAKEALKDKDLTGDYPPRFVDLKKQLYRDELFKSWLEVLQDLKVKTDQIVERGTDIIPRITHAELIGGLSPEQVKRIKDTGMLIVTDSISKEEALRWKQDIRDYAASNKDHLKGYPRDNIQIFELYNAPAQMEARTHAGMISTHKSLLSLLHVADASAQDPTVDLRCPISYFDRLRIRLPGDKTYTLGPHVDGGSVERWEDPGYRANYQKILDGKWKDYDPFDVTHRAGSKQDLYHAANTCSIFRPWQGWTSLSTTGPGEGTLRVLPCLATVTAYMILRPFFRLKQGAPADSIKEEDWELNLDNPEFPGCVVGGKQKWDNEKHPHLRLDKALLSIPKVEPGDQVYWFCDIVHAVEFEHNGEGDSSVIYIPAVPLTVPNATYLRAQRETFTDGVPAPDFPYGEGESKFAGRVKPEDIVNKEARQILGLEPYEGNGNFFRQVNEILGFA